MILLIILIILILIIFCIRIILIYIHKYYSDTKYVSYNYIGGLGNQLSGIYTAISFGLKYNKQPIFKYSESSPSITYRNTYWQTIFKNLNLYDNNSNIEWMNVLENNNSEYDEIVYQENYNIMFNGYFQSYNNFIDNLHEINDILKIREQQDEIKKKYFLFFNKPTIGIHFRLGDYKKLQDVHPLLNDEYYINALNTINLKHHILVFCEKEDYDIIEIRMKNIISKVYTSNSFEIIKIDNEIDEFLMLSLCNNIVIANSTYSWWAAVLSNHKNVYIPNKWFNEDTPQKLKFPDWIVTDSNNQYSLNLNNVYLISLEKDIQRRNDLGINPEYIYAVNGYNLDLNELKLGGILDKDSTLTKGEIGCYLSHIHMLNKILDSGKISLILEDDIKIDSDSILKINNYIHSIPEDADIVFISHNYYETFDNIENIPIKLIFGAQSYIVNTKNLTREKINKLYPIKLPYDLAAPQVLKCYITKQKLMILGNNNTISNTQAIN